jgi:polysaccharide deacetylase family protein (PEP-CTERM system associated)
MSVQGISLPFPGEKAICPGTEWQGRRENNILDFRREKPEERYPIAPKTARNIVGMKNALSIDLEDWFCAYNLGIGIEEWDTCELRIIENTQRLLDLPAAHDTRATFFILGWIAERVPDLLHEIEQHGHEIATHGYSHTILTEMTPESFSSDLEKALEVTRAHVSQKILGFRAPSFSITSETLWAIDVLVQHGIRYDSSIFPVNFHPDYGIPDSSLFIHQIGGLTEVPLS